MKQKKIFITGINGCIGHYLFDTLSCHPEYKLYLLVREPRKIRFCYQDNSQIEIICDSIENIDKYSDLLKEMDYLIHLAASWGGSKVFDINVNHTLSLFSFLDPVICKKAIYFSTASILRKDNMLNSDVTTFGTDYIKSKYECFIHLSELEIFERIYTSSARAEI